MRKILVQITIVLGYIVVIYSSISSASTGQTSSALVISEVMYYPEFNNNYNEWIELFNPTAFPVNVSGWTLFDGQQEDFLEGDFDHGNGTLVIPPKCYAIITDHETKAYENYSIPATVVCLYVDDSAICGYGLNNQQEKLLLKKPDGQVVDSVEWGYDYSDVAGFPAESVNEGNSLARYPTVDSNNSFVDFYFGITPTPGSLNQIDFGLDLYTTYVPKCYHDEEYSLPSAVKINIINIAPNCSYQLKSTLIGVPYAVSSASQTWDGQSWRYSGEYTTLFTTDEQGDWSGWSYIRFNSDYVEYQRHIMNSSCCFLQIKIKNETLSYTYVTSGCLLDLDNRSVNGTDGGIIVDVAESNSQCWENKTVIVETVDGEIVGLYVTENNSILEGFVSVPGYFKVACPVGVSCVVKVVDGNSGVLWYDEVVGVEKGRYGIRIGSPGLTYRLRRNQSLKISVWVQNVGELMDRQILEIVNVSEGWDAWLEQTLVSVVPGEGKTVFLFVTPCQQEGCRTGFLSLLCTSETDRGISYGLDLIFEVLGPDLVVTNMSCLNVVKQKIGECGEGEIISLKAHVGNKGNENGTGFVVGFFVDVVDESHCIGLKRYDSITRYYKYPIVEWDTSQMSCGMHTLFVVVDWGDEVEELDESNNCFEKSFLIVSTKPVFLGRSVVISELYYHCHPNVRNEFIVVMNPTDRVWDLSGWYLTNTPEKSSVKQTKVVFPDGVEIGPGEQVVVAQNASAYRWEMGVLPDFEYEGNLNDSVPELNCTKQFVLGNNGDAVCLKDTFNHTVDVVLYGETDVQMVGWGGVSVPCSGVGIVQKRLVLDTGVVDTNSSSDWNQSRVFGVGQSCFPYQRLYGVAEVMMFVSPDCSYRAVVSELDNATKSIYINIYEFTSPFLCDAVVNALQRNVVVRIFLEGSPVGGVDERELAILHRIAGYGGKIRFIISDTENRIHNRYPYNHGKYLIIDNHTVIVESCNWGKTGVPNDASFGNREWGIIVRNNRVAHYFLSVFQDDWNPSRCDSCCLENMNFEVPEDFFLDYTTYRGRYSPQFQPRKINGTCNVTPVFSPDTSLQALQDLISSAQNCIYIQQLYFYTEWKTKVCPLIPLLIQKADEGVDIRIILNYNPSFSPTNAKCNQTKKLLRSHGIKVQYLYTNWSYFTNMHNKGMIVDNTSVLISSINWNENSIMRNREAGVIVEHPEVASYYSEVFFSDWRLDQPVEQPKTQSLADYKNQLLIAGIYLATIALIVQDWRKRRWT